MSKFTLKEIKNYIKTFLSLETEKNIDEVDLFENGYIDSLKLFDFISFLESKFNIQFDPDDFEDRRFRTIKGIAEIIMEKKNILYNK